MTDLRPVLRDMRTPLAIEAADQIDALVKVLEDARLQLEYVQEKHGYATGEAVLARVRNALNNAAASGLTPDR